MIFSIGLDKKNMIVYHHNMKDTKIYVRMDKSAFKKRSGQNLEFIEFVGNQFRQLTRKNLGLPMKLYHL